MPRRGMTMTEGMVSGWLVQEGAEVTPDQEVVEIETTKITNVMEAGRGGVLRRIVVAPGTIAPVGALIAVLADPGVPDSEIDDFVAARKSETRAGSDDGAPAVRSVEAAGQRINVLSLGEGDATPVILLHGFGGDLNTWLFNQAALAEDRPVHALDLPAHGASEPKVGAGDLAALAGPVRAALDALGLGPVHLVGHSLGGAVAVAIAEQDPARIRSLTLIAPAGFAPEIGENYIEAFLAADRRKDMKETLGRLFADPGAVSRDMIESVQRFKRLDGVTEALRAIADAVFPAGRQAIDLRPTLAKLDTPVLLIQGDADRIIAKVAGLPATVRIEGIAGAGHMPQMEAAAAVNRLIAAYIAASD